MKTKKFRKKLTLKKQTVAELGNEVLDNVRGGTTATGNRNCSGCYSCDYVSFCGTMEPCTNIYC